MGPDGKFIVDEKEYEIDRWGHKQKRTRYDRDLHEHVNLPVRPISYPPANTRFRDHIMNYWHHFRNMRPAGITLRKHYKKKRKWEWYKPQQDYQEKIMIEGLGTEFGYGPDTLLGTNAWFDRILRENEIVVVIKGTVQRPGCNKTLKLLQIAYAHGINIHKAYQINVKSHPNLKEGFRLYPYRSGYLPIVPQLYLNGKLVGGFKYFYERNRSGKIIEELYDRHGHRSPLADAYKRDIHRTVKFGEYKWVH